MMHAIESESLSGKYLVQGWGFSVLLHVGLIVAIAFMMPKVTIVLEHEPFKWDVALVESPAEEASQPASEPSPIVEPPPAPVRKAPSPAPSPEPMESAMPRVAPQQSMAMIHPDLPKVQPVQPTPPVHPIEPAPAKPAPPEEIKTAEVREPEPIPRQPAKQELVEPEPVKQEVAKEPIREMPAAEPSAPAYAYQAPAAPAIEPPPPQESVPQPAPHAPAAEAAPPPSPAPSPSPSLEEPAPAASTPAEAPPQIAKLAPQAQAPAPQAKADHRWVGESLWRRVAELKRYPASARLNGLEGRVVLKVVIRADGHLADVSVTKSSGHAVLDAAAMEAVKLACPLHMKQPIGPPQIVVSLPIVYSLAN